MTLRPEDKYPNPKPKYLRDRNTGYVYIYSDKLFDKGFIPCSEIPAAQRRPEDRAEKVTGEPESPEVVVTDDAPEKSLLDKGLDALIGLTGNEEKTVAQMDINELLVFAKKNFGADIDPQAGIDAVRDEVIILQTAAQEDPENKKGAEIA